MKPFNAQGRAGGIGEFRRAITTPSPRPLEPLNLVKRRRIVVAVVLPLGVAILSTAISQKPDEPRFYWLLLVLASVWVVGAVSSGPLNVGGANRHNRIWRHVAAGLSVGLVLGCAFILGGFFVRQIPAVHELIGKVLQFAHHGLSLPLIAVLLANSIAEEVFFRGAVYAAVPPRYSVTISSVIYAVSVMATGNPMLGAAGIVVGVVCALERRVTAGLMAPALTHCVWGLMMLSVLPRVIGV